MRNRLFFLIAALCLVLSQSHSYAQKYIYGDVHDWLTNRLMENVKAVLMTSDSVVIDSMYTGWKGQVSETKKAWLLKVKDEPATYIVKFSFDNYQTQYKRINFNPRGRMKYYNYGTIKLKRQREQKLGVATVTASRVKFYTKKDTLVFNADAFQMAEGSMLDALIKQLPGVELKSNGEIYVNGKYVESLLLNGEEFFKKDNTVLLENLPSYTVNQVQVYKKQGDLSRFAGKNLGFDEEYVMDIKLKKQYSIGVLANAEGAAGTKDRYIGRLFALRFTPQSRVSAFVNFNNINETRKPGESGDWTPSNSLDGLQTTKTGGVDYLVSDKRKRFKVSGDVSLTHSDADNIYSSVGEQFLTGGNTFLHSYSRSRNCYTNFSTSHNWRFMWKKTELQFMPYFQYKNYNNYEVSASARFNRDITSMSGLTDSIMNPGITPWLQAWAVNRTLNETQNDGHDMVAYLYASVNQKIPFSDDFVNIDASASFQDYVTQSYNRYRLDYPQNANSVSDIRNRFYNEKPYKINSYYGRLRYWYFLPFNMAITPSYKYEHIYIRDNYGIYRLEQLADWNINNPLGMLPSESEYLNVVDRGNSFNKTLNTDKNEISIQSHWEGSVGKKGAYMSVSAELPLVITRRELDYQRDIHIDTLFSKTAVTFNPSFELTHNWHNWQRQVQLQYSMEGRLYDLVQTLDYRSDNNPLHIDVGNARLKNSYLHNLSLYYKNNSPRKQRSFNARLAYNISKNQFGYSRLYNRQTGATTFQQVNINGNYNVSGSVNYNMALDKKHRIYFGTSTSSQFYNNVDLITVEGENMNPRSKVKTLFLTETLKLDYKIGSQKIGAKVSGTWRNATSAREDFSTVNAANFNYGLTGQFELPFDFQIFTDLTMYSRRGYEAHEMNTDELVWNARLSKKFFKKRLTVALEGFDILHNLSTVTHSLNGQGRTETYRNVIPSYGMLHLIYRLNIQPKKRQ